MGRNPLKIRASLGRAGGLQPLRRRRQSQSLKDQGKSRTSNRAYAAKKGQWSQSLKDQGKSRTLVGAGVTAVVEGRNPLKIRASLGPEMRAAETTETSQSLKDQGKSRTEDA